MDKKKIVTVIASVGALAVLVAAMLLTYNVFKEKPAEGSKEITIEVVNSAGESTVYELKTDALYLYQAMDEAEGLEYEAKEGEYGLSVDSVNGERAVLEEGIAYWGFYVNDDYCMYGISEQPVEDGDAFKIEYTPM